MDNREYYPQLLTLYNIRGVNLMRETSKDFWILELSLIYIWSRPDQVLQVSRLDLI